MDDAFSRCHPAVNFLFFCAVIGFSMFLTHPVCQILSLCCGICCAARLDGRRTRRLLLCGMLPLAILAAAINPLFNHEGATILRYLPNGNPLTLEAVFFGLSAAVLMVTVIVWFFSFNIVVTSDKLLYLFGRVLPALSLVFSMTLRFVPRFAAQLSRITETQRALGRDPGRGGVVQRAKNAIAVLSILITWAMESAVATADSMKSRGYGLRGRTAFSIYRFTRRDVGLLLYIAVLSGCVLASLLLDGLYFQYYPVVSGTLTAPLSFTAYFAYGLLCLTPTILDWLEDRKWSALRSGI